MAWRCPLCLSNLGRTDILVHLCPRHPQSKTIACEEENLADIYCEWPECAEVINVEHGVILSHNGCSASNPFFRFEDQAIVIDGRTTLPNRVTVDHWQLTMLRLAAAQFPNRREMWFPQMLFRAANERPGDRRFASLVKLCGPRQVGKTTLATMALAYKSYVPPSEASLVRDADVKDFVYVSTEAEDVNPINFLNALYPSDLIRRGIAVADWIAASPSRRPNLKAAFVRLALADALTTVLPAPPDRESNVIVSAIREFLRDLVARGEVSATPRRAPAPPIQHSIVFYDSAGEDSVAAFMEMLARMDWQVDVVAALVTAKDLYRFGGGPRPDRANSVAVAVQQLRRVARQGPRLCLVVTKLDLITDEVQSPDDRALLEKIKANKWVEPNSVRQLLLSWLSVNDDSEQQLRGMLREPTDDRGRRLVDRVFFVWTEPDPERPHQIPYPAGLCNLILWCLDLEPRGAGGPPQG